MQSHRPRQIILKFLRSAPLRVVLIVPFALQTIAAVGVVGYLSFHNGQRAINGLADQLLGEVSRRIHQNLQTYLATPSAINQTNHNLLNQRLLTLDNLAPWELHLLQQVKIYHPAILYIGVGNTKGEYRSGEQLDDATLRLNFADDATGFRSYWVSPSGKRQSLDASFPAFRLRQRTEYQSIAKALKPIWTPIFTSLLQPTLLIARADPIVNAQNRFEGFVIASFRLDSIGRFLDQLTIGKTGQAFVIDRQGRLLATSTGEIPFRDRGHIRELIPATDSQNVLTQATAKYLEQSGSIAKGATTLQSFRLKINQEPQHLAVLPFRDEYGLDWFIVVVIPESDFMAQIHANNQITLLLCLGSAAIAIGLGIFSARWITRPLLELNVAAKKIMQGDWHQQIAVSRQDEVGELAHSFNQMLQQLQQSFAAMENLNQELSASKDQLARYNRSLETQIAERTEALEQANRELERLATTDSLTQVANRRRFDDYLQQQWSHTSRSQSPLSLILCDVDYFKRYNDHYGHQLGDECLKQVAQAIRDALQRSTDLAARYGGEEFGIILPYSDLNGAMLVAEAIQTKIQELQCPHSRSEVSSYITVSMGIASLTPERSLSPKTLLKAADAALYQAKTQGRNRYAIGQVD
jgi:diguanylate cyclase (GGDEF)-like protein